MALEIELEISHETENREEEKEDKNKSKIAKYAETKKHVKCTRRIQKKSVG